MKSEISLAKFLSRYLNVTGEGLGKLTHDDVKVLFPNVTTCAYEDLKSGMLCSGEVLLVNDGKRTTPYYTPPIFDLDPEEAVEIEMIQNSIQRDYRYHDYTSMSVYELKQLLDRKFNSDRNSKKAKEELKSRGAILTRKYNRTLEKRMWKKESERY